MPSSQSHPRFPSPPGWSRFGGGTAVTSHPSAAPCCTRFQLSPGCRFSGEMLGIFLDTLARLPPLWGVAGHVSSSLCSWPQTLLDLKTAGFSCLCISWPCLVPRSPRCSRCPPAAPRRVQLLGTTLNNSFCLGENSASGRATGCGLNCLRCILAAPAANSVPFIRLLPQSWVLCRAGWV